MIALYFVIATLIWLYIGYISALIIFKMLKEDIFESYNFFWICIAGGPITIILGILFGIGYLAIIIPYKLLHSNEKEDK